MLERLELKILYITAIHKLRSNTLFIYLFHLHLLCVQNFLDVRAQECVSQEFCTVAG